MKEIYIHNLESYNLKGKKLKNKQFHPRVKYVLTNFQQTIFASNKESILLKSLTSTLHYLNKFTTNAITTKIANITKSTAPNIPHIPSDIVGNAGAKTTTNIITIKTPIAPSIISSKPTKIHQNIVIHSFLKSLWVSLISKGFFDTPIKDAYLSIKKTGENIPQIPQGTIPEEMQQKHPHQQEKIYISNNKTHGENIQHNKNLGEKNTCKNRCPPIFDKQPKVFVNHAKTNTKFVWHKKRHTKNLYIFPYQIYYFPKPIYISPDKNFFLCFDTRTHIKAYRESIQTRLSRFAQ